MIRDALVVGINHYQKLPKLHSPAHDAEAIASCLETYGEFRVHRMPEIIASHRPKVGQRTAVSTRQLETALIKLFKPDGKSIPQTAIFYFSGHGLQRNAGIQEGYLSTSEADPETRHFGVSLFWLRRLLQESPVPQKIIWLDCCHSGELLNFLEVDPGAQSGKDRLFMAASREYEAAYESLTSNYSVFTKALLNGLKPRSDDQDVVTSYSLMKSVSHQLKGELQQPLFEASGSEIILTRSTRREACLPPAPDSTLDRLKQLSLKFCPFPGLKPFSENQGDFFFGRELLTQELIQNIKKNRFCTIIGPSNSGKTSLLRAGLIYQLKHHQTENQKWEIRYLTPTQSPLMSLASAFINPTSTCVDRAEQLHQAEGLILEGKHGLNKLAQASLIDNSPTQTFIQSKTLLQKPESPQVLLIIDHFEELFTLCKDENQRQQFVDCLVKAIQSRETNLRIVISIRDDYTLPLSLYPRLFNLMNQNSLHVHSMNYEQIKSTIVEPAKKLDVEFEPTLVCNILLDIVGAPGELSLVQLLLERLWYKQILGSSGDIKRITLQHYADIGGIHSVVSQYATAIYEQLSFEEQQVAQRIFLSLCEIKEGMKNSQRRINKLELINEDFSADIIEHTLEKLIDLRLVVVGKAKLCNAPLESFSTKYKTVEIVDIVHESLVQHWSLLCRWIQENQEILQRRRWLESAAQEWYQQGGSTDQESLLVKNRLLAAEFLLRNHPTELSTLAKEYVRVSRRTQKYKYLKVALLSFLIPCSILASFAWVLSARQDDQELATSAVKAVSIVKDLGMTKGSILRCADTVDSL